MRPVHEVTAQDENFRLEPMFSDGSCPGATVIRRDPVEPEPVGTVVLRAFRVVGYDQDCDGSLMARLASIDRHGKTTGWTPDCIGLYPDSAVVVTQAEWAAMFQGKEST